MFHICNTPNSVVPIVERGRIQIFISSIALVWNGLSIYLKVCTSGVCGKYKNKNDRENVKRCYEGLIEGPYPGEKCRGKDDIFKAMTYFIFRWVWKKHPKIQINNTNNYTSYHLYRVRGFQYLRHLCADQMLLCKFSSSCHIWTSQQFKEQNHSTCLAWSI